MVRWSLKDPLVSGTTAVGIGHLWANDIILEHVSTYWSYYRSVGAVIAFAGAVSASTEAVAASARAVIACAEAVAASAGVIFGVFS